MSRILIKNTSLFNGRDAQLMHGSIVVDGNRIRCIESGEVSEEAFQTVIDGSHLTAIPGLTDCHVHLGWFPAPDSDPELAVIIGAKECEKLLLHGITTVRDAGGVTVGLKKAVDMGVIPGPRIYPSNAYISQTCGHGDSQQAHRDRDLQYRISTFTVLADGPDEVRRAVREQFYKGASQIKIMAGGGLTSVFDPVNTLQFSEVEIKAAVEAASDYGTYVMAHVYTPGCIRRAVSCGVKSLEHAQIMDEETAVLVRDSGAFVDPCPQFTEEEMRWSHIGKYSDYPEIQYGKKTKPGISSEELAEKIARTTELLIKYRIPLLFGTDMMIFYPDYEPRALLDLMEYGKRFGSLDTLRAATGNVNDLIRLTTYQNPYPEGKIGVLEKGSYADILLTEGNPAKDIRILRDVNHIRLIMKDGIIYKDTTSQMQKI